MALRYRWDDFVLDLDAYRVQRGGVPVPLEPKAVNLLALMVRRPGHLFSKPEIFAAVWPDAIVTDHALTRVVAQLRRALGDEAREARYIETVPTRGYRWIQAVEEVATDPVATTQPPAPPLARKPLFTSLAATLVAVVALLTTIVWTQRETGARPSTDADRTISVKWPVQLTTHDGLDLQPSLSPAGDAVAFASDRTGSLEIFVRGLDRTATETQLTEDQGQNVQPAWSPDARLIAYHSSSRGGIWVIPARAGIPKQLAAVGSNPSWSPDGKRIAFESDEHTDVTPNAYGAQSGSTIWVVNSDGSHLRDVTRAGNPIGGHAAPAWSPDGRRIAFSVFEGGKNNGVWLASLDGQAPSLLENGAGLYEAVFAPDGSALYVAGGEALIVRIPYDIASATARGKRELIPVAGVQDIRGLTISADGARLSFGGLALNSQIWAQPITRSGLPVGAARSLTRDTSRRNSLPVVSPDGLKVAYVSSRRGELPNIWTIDVDGGNATQVTANESAEYMPHWFPDGRRIAYVSTRNERTGIWAVDAVTRKEELFFDLAGAQAQVAQRQRLAGRLAEFELAPSMSRVAFSLITPPGGRRLLYVADADVQSPRALSDQSTSAGYPAWSPDEQSIAVEVKEGSSTNAAVIDLSTGSMRRLTSERGQTWVSSWSPDGKKVAVAALRQGRWSLQWIDAQTGAVGTMMPPSSPRVFVRYPDWSPRGDRVVFERGELRGNIWMLPLR
jgi:Tol biopolymer transport system component/DNA-binding winged helix-turn-helix (wHTH) protein